MNITADGIAAGMAIITFVCGAVYFVMSLMQKPVKDQLADTKKKVDADHDDLVRLGTRQDHIEREQAKHSAEDGIVHTRLELALRDLGREWREGMAELKREIKEDTGEISLRRRGANEPPR